MITRIMHNCPICKEDIVPGEKRRIIGLDQSRWPGEPPRSIYAHTDCCLAVHFSGAVLIRPGQDLDAMIAAGGVR